MFNFWILEQGYVISELPSWYAAPYPNAAFTFGPGSLRHVYSTISSVALKFSGYRPLNVYLMCTLFISTLTLLVGKILSCNPLYLQLIYTSCVQN